MCFKTTNDNERAAYPQYSHPGLSRPCLTAQGLLLRFRSFYMASTMRDILSPFPHSSRWSPVPCPPSLTNPEASSYQSMHAFYLIKPLSANGTSSSSHPDFLSYTPMSAQITARAYPSVAGVYASTPRVLVKTRVSRIVAPPRLFFISPPTMHSFPFQIPHYGCRPRVYCPFPNVSLDLLHARRHSLCLKKWAELLAVVLVGPFPVRCEGQILVVGCDHASAINLKSEDVKLPPPYVRDDASMAARMYFCRLGAMAERQLTSSLAFDGSRLAPTCNALFSTVDMKLRSSAKLPRVIAKMYLGPCNDWGCPGYDPHRYNRGATHLRSPWRHGKDWYGYRFFQIQVAGIFKVDIMRRSGLTPYQLVTHWRHATPR
ncbi:hypothetical protein R3P38DRAFT_3195311 [Favolaschia claudopus]|uniref:Uncharacterized protein n=1 Tax=Favolaschia claudopus TaxID=2862362 RepID=A0AAW0BCM5_9AGAR